MATARKHSSPTGNQCLEHPEEPFKFYCTAHNELICCICAIKQHKACSDTLTLPEAVERFERERGNLFKALTNQSHVIETAVSQKTVSVDSLEPSTMDVKSKICSLRQKFHGLLEMKETELLNSADVMAQQERESLQGDIESLQRLSVSAARVKEKAEHAFHKKTQLSMIKAMAKVQNAYCEIERAATSALDNPVKNIDFQVSMELEEFLEQFESLGEVTLTPADKVEEQPEREREASSTSGFLSVQFVTSGDSDTSWSLQYPRFTSSLEDIDSSSSEEEEGEEGGGVEEPDLLDETSDSFGSTLKADDTLDQISPTVTQEIEPVSPQEEDPVMSFLTVDHGKPCWLYGLAYLPDRRLVITDVAHDSLQLYDVDCVLLSETKVGFTPWDVVTMGDNTIAICAGGKGTINIFSLHNNDFVPVKNLDVGSDCISLAYRNSVFTAGTRRGGILLSEDGEVMMRIEKSNGSKEVFRRADFLSTDEQLENIYITNSWASKIVCVTSDGRKKWEFQNKDSNPRGVAWSEDRLYIASRNQHKIISLDKEGVCQEEVIAEGRDGLECPYALDIHRAEQILAVSQWDEKMMAEKTRRVHVFRLL